MSWRTWTLCRMGDPSTVLAELRADVEQLGSDLDGAEAHVPHLLVDYLEDVLGLLTDARQVRVVASSDNSTPRGFGVDIRIIPDMAPIVQAIG